MNGSWNAIWGVSQGTAALFDGLYALFGWWTLILVSAATGVLMLLLFKATSWQSAIKKVKDKMNGAILEMRLYKDDIRIMLSAAGKVLGYNFLYLSLALPSIVLMIAIILPVFVQLDLLFGYRGIEPGHRAVLTVRYKNDEAGSSNRGPEMEISCPDSGIVVETEMKLPGKPEKAWRLYAEKPGRHNLTIAFLGAGGEPIEELTLPVVASKEQAPVVHVRRSVADGFTEAVLEPGGRPIPKDSRFSQVEVRGYETAGTPFLLFEMSWIWPFLIVSLLVGFAFKGVFKVQI